MPHAPIETRAACIDNPALFQHELLEEPVKARQGTDAQRRQALLAARAAAVCAGCPLFTSCLYEAVVDHDVAGFVAGSTEAQRVQMRHALGVKVEPDDLDVLAGVVRGGRQINHDEVVRLRQANPHESLEVLAMRRARTAPAEVKLAMVKPSVERVLAVFAAVVGYPRRPREQRVA